MKRGRLSARWLVLCALMLALSAEMTVCAAEEEEALTPPKESATDAAKPAKTDKTDEFDASSEDWGSYYDPQAIFCGKFDCYKILGFDYESYRSAKPDKKVITQRYRKLSREWHPDKSKHKNAKDRFVHIARAYEVLTDKEQREEYDFLRYNQEAYFRKYGTSVLWSYAPKTDATFVIFLLFIVGNIISWYMQKHRWQMVADRLIKSAVEDWSPSQGGSAESKKLREEAMAVIAEKEQEANGDVAAVTESLASPTKTGKKASKGKQKKEKVSSKDKKEQEVEVLLPIITDLVNQMEDFGGGFHQPTYRDLLVVGFALLPYNLTVGTFWLTKCKLHLRISRNHCVNFSLSPLLSYISQTSSGGC
jgi:DnaJ family protein C protein 25